ncbi:MAG: PD-(D/E)XK nuclease family transposase [Treponema sp.]|nr:PD-(D/E)XK nuclease family transposase [Treponema sp.]
MTIVFSGDNEATEFLLHILLSRDDLKVKSSMTQKEKRNLFGRSVRLDIVAEDTEGKTYNVEVQRADKGASPRRVRYNLAMLDSHTLKKNDDFSALPETYIIFITENDYVGQGKAFYEVGKSFIGTAAGDKPDLIFDDGCHIMYVNGEYRGNDAIGHLMHDFGCRNADDMHYDELAERVRFHKQQSKGVGSMCRIFEEYGNERAAEAKAEIQNEFVENLLRQNKLSAEEISAVAKVPLEQVRQISQKLTKPVC